LPPPKPETRDLNDSEPYTLHPAPCTLHSYTLEPSTHLESILVNFSVFGFRVSGESTRPPPKTWLSCWTHPVCTRKRVGHTRSYALHHKLSEAFHVSGGDRVDSQPYALHPTSTPYTIHPTPSHTPHPLPYALNPLPYSLFPTPYSLLSKSEARNPTL